MTRFLLDTMLGRLATYLRMCGHDTGYALDQGIEADGRIIKTAREAGRVLLTRDRDLADRYEGGFLLESRDLHGQLQEVVDAGYALELPETPERCGVCNGSLGTIPPDSRTPSYAPSPDETDLWQCGDCGQFFWKGSHWDNVAKRLEEIG
jgi:uncharacterized protein with PIN domain